MAESIDITKFDKTQFKNCYVGCVILTQDHKILLQQRNYHCLSFPGFLSTFGGRIESGETPIQALLRELHEELGAEVHAEDVIELGAITEEATKHQDLIYVYFWQDKYGTITGCYEGEARLYSNYQDVYIHPKVTEDVFWILKICKERLDPSALDHI